MTTGSAPVRTWIKRNGQEFGPYPGAALVLYLEQGSLLSTDLARMEHEAPTAWRPLTRLLRELKIDAPVLRGHWRPRRLWSELRSLDPGLILPWRDVRSGRWAQDLRVLLFVCVGMLPIVVVCMNPSIELIYVCFSLYFSAVWAIYFFQMFRTPEVSARTAACCFAATGVSAVFVVSILAALPPFSLFYRLADGGGLLARWLGMTFGVGVTEEACKAAVVYYVASRPGRVLLPQTVVLYGLLSGLGFGCAEGIAYQLGLNRSQPTDVAFVLNILRLTSLPFMHAVWSGISAYFIGFSVLVPRRRGILLLVAVAIPATIHGLYNTFNGGLIALIPAILGVFFLMSYLGSCRELKDHLAKPRP